MSRRRRKATIVSDGLEDIPALSRALTLFIRTQLDEHPPHERVKIAEVCANAARNAYSEIASEVAEAENRLEIGNCFRTIEKQGDPTESFPIWFKVVKVDGTQVTYLSFHVRPDGHVVIEPEWWNSNFVIKGYERVPNRVFDKAWKRMLQHVARVRG